MQQGLQDLNNRDPYYMPPGMTGVGNIDVNHRPVIHNANGSVSTIYSATEAINKDGTLYDGAYDKAPGYVLIPQIAGGKFLTPDGKMPDEKDRKAMVSIEDAAREQYAKTGQHLGRFSSNQAANDFADETHAWVPTGTAESVYLPAKRRRPSKDRN